MNSTTTTEETADLFEAAVSYVPILIIIIGVVSNTTAFIIFRFNNDFKSMSSMVYFSFVTITDTLSLFGWNLDHFISYNFHVTLTDINEYCCHIIEFQQYFSLQSSAVLLSMATIDRYVTVISIPGSFVSNLPFRTPRSAFNWSLGILIILAAINIHILLFPRMKNPRGFNCNIYINGFNIFPVWEYVHLVIFSLIPFILMTIFNGLLIKNVLTTGQTASIHYQKMKNKRKKMTFSLIIATIIFLVMTIPASISYGFLYDFFSTLKYGSSYLKIIDYLSFLNSSSIFFITFATNTKFRVVLWKYLGSFKRLFLNTNKSKSESNSTATT